MDTIVQVGFYGKKPEKHLLHHVNQRVTSSESSKKFGSCTELFPVNLGSRTDSLPASHADKHCDYQVKHSRTIGTAFCNRSYRRANAIASEEVVKPFLDAIALDRGWHIIPSPLETHAIASEAGCSPL